tara:strand:+ start:123 stop:488 length:366 start_codon:yes stop_codon:yes gene_type:complete
MGFSSRRREKQVRLAVFGNEPLARLAEQRLRQVGIPCITRCLRGGPGLWGSAYNLPHDLYVYESDEMQARDVLGPATQELVELDDQAPSQRSGPNFGLLLVGATFVALVLVTLVSLFKWSR